MTSPSQPMGEREGTPGVGVGVMVGVRLGVALGSGVGLAVGEAVAGGVSEGRGIGVSAGVGLGGSEGVDVGVSVDVGVGVSVGGGVGDSVGVGVGFSTGAGVGVSVGAGVSVINCSDSELACPSGTARKASQIPARESARAVLGRRALNWVGIIACLAPQVGFDPKDNPAIRTAPVARPSGRVRYWLLAGLADGHDRPATSCPRDSQPPRGRSRQWEPADCEKRRLSPVRDLPHSVGRSSTDESDCQKSL
jgi:hypothetical protein